MGRTSTRRWFRLWAVRRWRLVEQQFSGMTRNADVSPKLLACLCCPVCCTRNQVRQERLQGSIPPAAAHLQQCHDPRGRQSQAAHRLRSSERCTLTRKKIPLRCFGVSDGFVLQGSRSARSATACSCCTCPVTTTNRRLKTTSCFCVNLWAWGAGSQGVLVSSQGDVILQSDHVIETLTKLAICADKIDNININQGRWAAALAAPRKRPHGRLTPTVLLFPPPSIKFTVGQGKEGIIDFTPGSELIVAKAKNGHLSVVRQPNTPVFALKKTLWAHENAPVQTCGRVSGTLTHEGGAPDCSVGCDAFFSSPSLPDGPQTELQMIPAHTRHQEPRDSWPLPSTNHECRPRSASANQTPAAAAQVALTSN